MKGIKTPAAAPEASDPWVLTQEPGGLWSAMGRRGGVDAWREVVAAQLQSPVSDEDVRVAAYFLFENGHPGGADSHWFAAERAFAPA